MSRRFSPLDPKALRALAGGVALFAGVWLVFFVGAQVLGLKGPQSAVRLQHWLGAGLPGPLALPVAVAGFTVLAFLGAPQVVLIAAAVVAFGPWAGMAYSWIGTEISAIIGFAIGRRFGAQALRQYAGKGVQDFIDLVGKNGFLATVIVRQVPIAPFVIVNLAAGITTMRLRDFALGTALGIAPKIALTAFVTAFAGNALTQGAHGGWMGFLLTAVGLIVSGLIWLASGWAARKWLKRETP